MFGSSFRSGYQQSYRKGGLVLLIYAFDLALALLIAVPIYAALLDVTGSSGFGRDLAGAFDAVVWADILEKLRPALRGLPGQLLFAVPLFFVWRSARSAGLVHALRDGDGRSFWQGVGRYTGRMVLLGLLFLVTLVGVLLVVAVAGMILNAGTPGEVADVWTNFILLPLATLFGLALVDMMRDFASAALIVEECSVSHAWREGMKWPFKHASAWGVYFVWFLIAVPLLAIPTLLDMSMTAATLASILWLFVFQQMALVLRAAATVGWIGSEVALFETFYYRSLPTIADTEVPPLESIGATLHEDVGAAPGPSIEPGTA